MNTRPPSPELWRYLCFLAIERNTKLVLNFSLGKRNNRPQTHSATARPQMRRLTRWTNGFARKGDNLSAVSALRLLQLLSDSQNPTGGSCDSV